jgi:hypothetical protein
VSDSGDSSRYFDFGREGRDAGFADSRKKRIKLGGIDFVSFFVIRKGARGQFF